MKQTNADLVIVGAGPAGLSAAKVAAEVGLSVVVLDEFPTPGGRMLGQYHEEPGRGWWVGKQVAAEIIAENRRLGVSIHCETPVHGLERNGTNWVVLTPDGRYQSRFLLLATGAAEVPNPLPGWTLPGVMSIGAAQVMTNVHLVKPGQRGLIIGVNVLAMAIARELSVSGVELAGIVLPPDNIFTQGKAKPESALALLSRLSYLAPSGLLRMGGRLAQNKSISAIAKHLFPRRGITIWDIPLKLRTAAVKINGTDQVESVTLVDLDGNGNPIDGSEREEAVDFVAISSGLYPLAELASIAGCEFVHMPELGGYLPMHNEQLQTNLPGLYVAGNITGVESALVAMAQGRLAATSICSAAGKLAGQTSYSVQTAMEDVKRTRSEALIQFHPGIEAARTALYQAE